MEVTDSEALEATNTLRLLTLVSVAGLGLGSRKIDGSHVRNNNQCSYKLTSITRLGSLHSLGSEDDVH